MVGLRTAYLQGRKKCDMFGEGKKYDRFDFHKTAGTATDRCVIDFLVSESDSTPKITQPQKFSPCQVICRGSYEKIMIYVVFLVVTRTFYQSKYIGVFTKIINLTFAQGLVHD